jgi:transketolase C-terminal domain/subunit
VGMEDCFGESGSAEQLMHKYKLDYHQILKKAKEVLHR